MKYLSQFLQCLHWEGFHSAWAFMCIFKLCPLENILAHISHLESLSPESSGHVDLQTLPTWENFCTTSAYASTFSRNKAFTQRELHVHLQVVSTRKCFSDSEHISHKESLSSVNSDHVDLQSLPTWENFCTTSAYASTFSRNKAFTQPELSCASSSCFHKKKF